MNRNELDLNAADAHANLEFRIYNICFLFCVEVLRPSQPNGDHVECGQFT